MGGASPHACLRPSMIARHDKYAVVTMFAVREICARTRGRLCRPFCLQMGGRPPPACLRRSMIARNGKYRVVTIGSRGRLRFSSSKRIRGSQSDDSHEDCDPDPRDPCDNWHFLKIRRVEGLEQRQLRGSLPRLLTFFKFQEDPRISKRQHLRGLRPRST